MVFNTQKFLQQKELCDKVTEELLLRLKNYELQQNCSQMDSQQLPNFQTHVSLLSPIHNQTVNNQLSSMLTNRNLSLQSSIDHS